MARLLAALVVAVVCLFAQPVKAAACCSSATVSGVGRLLVWEEMAFGINLGAATGTGRWASDGQWRPFAADYTERELAPSVWGIVRVGEKWEVQAKLPWIVNFRSSGEISSTGHGAGDALTAVRYQITGIGEYLEIPAIAVTAGMTLPTGRREESAFALLGADATGRGVWEGSASVSVEQTWGSWFLRLDAGGRASLPFHRTDKDVSQRYGPGLSLALTGGKEVIPGLSVALLAQHEREGAIFIDGESVEGSSSNGQTASAAVSWRFTPHWTVQAAVSGGIHHSGWGENRPGRFSTTWGLRYGHF